MTVFDPIADLTAQVRRLEADNERLQREKNAILTGIGVDGADDETARRMLVMHMALQNIAKTADGRVGDAAGALADVVRVAEAALTEVHRQH